MATRRLAFFMRFDEFVPLLWERVLALGLSVIMVPGGRQPCEIASQPGDLALSDGTMPWRVYLAAVAPVMLPDNNGVKPGEWGWVQADVPHESGNRLYKSTLAAKSDWWDSKARRHLENPASLELFGKVAPAFRKHLHYPVWAYNVMDETPQPQRYRTLGYSDGAAEWFHMGYELRQSSHDFVRYIINGTIQGNPLR
jgi:hypothetical protein